MSFLLEVLLRGLVVSGVGLLALAFLGRASAATRGAAATVVLGALLVLPLGLLVAPKQALPPERIPFGEIVSERLAVPIPQTNSVVEPSSIDASPTSGAPIPYDAIVVAVWAAVATGTILRLGTGWIVALGWVRRSSSLLSDADDSGVEVRVSNEIAVPCALWAGRPVVLLPKDHIVWSEERRQAVLLHETAHIRRGDWAGLVLSRVVAALHWPNPLAWALARTARRAAEDAADDAVLRTGLAPADYADHLLALAPRRSGLALVLPMASRPDIHRRIRHVLNPKRTLGSVSLVTLAFASLLIGGVFVPAACLVAGQRRSPALRPQIESPYRDIQEGWTQPGTPYNHFIGRFADRTTAQIVQISMHTPQGIRAWKPNGDPIPEAARRPVEHLGDHYRSILVRYAKRTTEPEGGLGSGPRTGGEPSMLGFNSSRNQPGPNSGEWESYQFIEVPKEDGDRASFTFSLSNEPWRTYRFVIEPRALHGRLDAIAPRVGEDIRNVVVDRTIAMPVLHDAQGFWKKDANGKPIRGKEPSTALTFTPPTNGEATYAFVTARLRSGGIVKPFWNENIRHNGEFRIRDHFRQKPEAIASFEIRTRGYRYVEFLDVRLKPNAR